jgi:hypothetical protein
MSGGYAPNPVAKGRVSLAVSNPIVQGLLSGGVSGEKAVKNGLFQLRAGRRS